MASEPGTIRRRHDPTDASVWLDRSGGPTSWRWHLPGLALAAGMVLATVVVGVDYGLSPRDTDKMLGSRSLLVVVLVVAFLALDVLPHAWRRRQGGLLAQVRAVLLERWTRRRVLVVVLGFVSFYATYLSYRNLKSFVPFLVPQDDDSQLLRIDRLIFGGHDPGVVLHDVLGTGIAAQVLSLAYIFFLAFVPLSLAWVLMTWTNPIPALWYVTALGLNWTLGVVSYLVLPSVGPIFTAPALYATLPVTGVSELQHSLLVQRAAVLADPSNTANVQSIAAFASLHVSVVLTAALIAQLLGLRGAITRTLWAYLAVVVVATLYFGWHYVLDDVAGALIGVVAVVAGGLATGHLGVPRRLRRQTSSTG